MKKLLFNVLGWLVSMFCVLLFVLVFSMCRLLISMVNFGVVRVSSCVLLISSILVGML